MQRDEQRIVHALRTIAAEAGPLRLRVDDLGPARRRRARRRFAVGVGVAAVIAGGAAVGFSVAGDAGGDRPTGPARAPAATSAGDAGDPVSGPLRIACGQPLPVRPTSAPFGGTDVAITGVAYPSIDGPPLVTYRLALPTAAARRAGHVEPEVLVLRDGIVVGGPPRSVPVLGPSGRVESRAEQVWPPDRTFTLTRPAPTWLCGLTDWAAIRSDPTGYRLAVVLSLPRRGSQPPPTGPLLIAQTDITAK
jgi:hypothetical protein